MPFLFGTIGGKLDIKSTVVSTFNPTNVTGLLLWLDASDPNGNGTVPTNGTTFTTWTDKSGKGSNATANSAVTYSSTGFNSKPSFTFDNTKWFTGNITDTNSTISVFALCSMSSSSTASARVIGFSNGAGVNDYNNSSFFGFLRQSNTGLGPYRGGTYQSNNPAAYSTPLLWECWFDGTNMYSTVQNGASTVLNTTANSGAFGISFYNVGNNPNTADTNGPFYGYISEIVVYSTSLTQLDRQKVEGYLSWKWGLQANLPSSHPYYSAKP